MKPRFLLATFLAIPVITAVAICIAGRMYWGHWFAPPALDDTVAALTSIQRFSEFSASEPILGESGPTALMSEVTNANDGLGESPAGRLPAALVRRNLIPTSSEPVDPWLRHTVIRTLATGGGCSRPPIPATPILTDCQATLQRVRARPASRLLLRRFSAQRPRTTTIPTTKRSFPSLHPGRWRSSNFELIGSMSRESRATFSNGALELPLVFRS